MVERLAVMMTTCGSPEEAERLARLLVEKHLAACVAIGPSQRSIYPWEGRIEVDEEVPLLIKTARERLDDLKQTLETHHPYDVPEGLVLSVDDGLEDYLAWARGWLQIES